MTDRRGQGVGGVSLDLFLDVEQRSDHGVDLQFFSPTVAGDSLLDLQGRVFGEGTPGRGHGRQDRAPHLAEGDGRLDVLGIKRALYGHFVRGMGGDHLSHLQGDRLELQVKGQAAGGLDGAEGPHCVANLIVVDDTIPRGLTSGVDAENPHEVAQAEKRAISSSEMS